MKGCKTRPLTSNHCCTGTPGYLSTRLYFNRDFSCRHYIPLTPSSKLLNPEMPRPRNRHAFGAPEQSSTLKAWRCRRCPTEASPTLKRASAKPLECEPLRKAKKTTGTSN